MLLIVMHESGTWRVRPGQVLTFGRGAGCVITLPVADRGVSRSAGSLVFEQGTWWLRNDSSSSVLYVSGDRGFRVDLPPGMQVPVQQWHVKVRLQGLLDSYSLRLRLPDLDDVPEQDPGSIPRALEELATLLISTGELTADDLRRLPSRAPAQQGPG